MGQQRELTETEVAAIIEQRKAGGDISVLARQMHVGHKRLRAILDEHGLGSREGKRFRMLAEKEREMVARYAAGESSLTLGALYGCDPATVRNAAHRAGVPVNHVGGDPAVRTADEIAAIRTLAAQGLAQSAIGRRLHMGQTTVSRLMRIHGIPIGKKGVGRREQHSGWKGGRSRDAAGYVLVRLAPHDPLMMMARQSGYVPEHRLVMARYLGRPLTRHETVHHKNGNITDNRLENLQLCIGSHSNTQAFCCCDCGSYNVVAVELARHQLKSRPDA